MDAKHKDYYSTREAAKLLEVAVSTIQLWTNNGLLKAWVTAGGHRRIAKHSVDELLNRQKEIANDGKSENLTMVIVEDSAQQMRLYKKQFSVGNINARILTAVDGYEGLIKIGRFLPEIIITDLKMPNMDGFRMIEAIKMLKDLNDSLIIVVSGLSEVEIEANGGLPDGVSYFRKPVDFESLISLVRNRIIAKAA